MGIKSNKQQGRIYVSPLSIQGEIIVLSGSPVQTYDKQLREYSPDRTLTPLVIVPKVSAFDEKTVFGEMELTGVEWFEGAPRDKSANRIVEGEYYSISDGSGGVPNTRLPLARTRRRRSRWSISASRYSRTLVRTVRPGSKGASGRIRTFMTTRRIRCA